MLHYGYKHNKRTDKLRMIIMHTINSSAHTKITTYAKSKVYKNITMPRPRKKKKP